MQTPAKPWAAQDHGHDHNLPKFVFSTKNKIDHSYTCRVIVSISAVVVVS